jgi:hypothetical protein
MHQEKLHQIPIIELFGDIEENFYQLGLKDRENGKKVHQSIKKMLSTPYRLANQAIEELGKHYIKRNLNKKYNKYGHLKAYAEGLSTPLEEVLYTVLMPEMISSMSKWKIGLKPKILGCSSFFMLNENNSPIHGRILDFPLSPHYDEYERAIHYQLNGMPNTFAFNSAGIPYPSITLFTDEGMSVAIHQKFTDIFVNEGESIFEIVFELIKNAGDKKSAIDFLKSKKSITTWSLYMGFKNGEVLAYDIMGNENFYNEFQLENNQILYFGNYLENKNLNKKNYEPWGFYDYNDQRKISAEYKIKDFLQKKHKKDIDEKLLKMMSTPKSHQSIDTLTAFSLTSVVMNPTEKKCSLINGIAPKVYQGQIQKIESVFNDPNSKSYVDNKYHGQNKEYFLGLKALNNAQNSFDQKDAIAIYHQLQMAITHLEGKPEQYIAEFYFFVAQYIFENDKKILAHLITDFTNIKERLPPHLKEQCVLFITRLEYILNLPGHGALNEITNTNLKELLEYELKIPASIFHFTTKSFIVPRIDILDVIYVNKP